MLTTRIILEEFNRASENIYECVIRNSRVYSQIQQDEKEELNKHDLKCPIQDISKYISSVDFSRVKDVLNDNFYDSKSIQTTACLTDTILYLSKDRSGFLDFNDQILNWFDSAEKIGSDSVYGTAISTSIKGTPGMLVLKAPKSNNQDNTLHHELFVGFFGTNAARKDNIPNFVYIFGGFECSPPVVTEDSVIICGTRAPKVQYVIYENIPGKSLEKTIENMSPLDFYSIMLQILFATIYGYEKFDWTHYDLHDDNVILRPLKETKRIKYIIKGRDYYVPSNYVATMIDYGKSHISYEGKHYGILQCNGYIFPEVSFPLYDIYKYLASAIITIANANIPNKNDYLAICYQFFSYFNNQENMVDAIAKQLPTYHVIPNNNYTKKQLNIYGLLNHLSRFRTFQSFLGDNDTPLLISDKIENINIIGDKVSIISYFDSKSSPNRKEIREKLISRKEEASAEFVLNFDSIRSRVIELISIIPKNITSEIIYSIADSDFFTINSLNICKKYLNEVIELKFKLRRADLYLMIGKDVFIEIDLKIYKELNLYDSEFQKLKTESQNIFVIARDVCKAIEIKCTSAYAAEMIRRNPQFLWYSKEAPFYL